MSQMSEIRDWMKSQSGPVSSSQVAEAFELPNKQIADLLRNAAKQECGIERLDDGTYSLIPGWKPKPKGRAAAAEGAAAKQSAPAAPRKSAGTARVGPKRSYKRRTKVDSQAALGHATTPLGNVTQISRTALRVLTDAVLDSSTPIDGDLRAALREATAAAA